jgi:hypothetical protein
VSGPTPIHLFRDNQAVDPDAGGAAAVAPLLAAIQHSYEEAKACIADPARSSSARADGQEPLPDTEAIDLRAVPLPAVPDAVAATAPMSLAAGSPSERMVVERPRPPAAGGGPVPTPAAPAGQGWWQRLRARSARPAR